MNSFYGRKKVLTRAQKITGLNVRKTSVLGDFYKALDGLKTVAEDIATERQLIADEKQLLADQESILDLEEKGITKLVGNFEKLLDV